MRSKLGIVQLLHTVFGVVVTQKFDDTTSATVHVSKQNFANAATVI